MYGQRKLSTSAKVLFRGELSMINKSPGKQEHLLKLIQDKIPNFRLIGTYFYIEMPSFGVRLFN